MAATRIQSIDFVRAVSIIGIFMCHYFMYGNIAGVSHLGRFLAGTFNIVFFCISALLFGLSWSKSNKQPFKSIPFLKKRMARLAASYWPWLTVVFVLFYLLEVPFTVKQMIMNYGFMAWFSKLPGVPHFWFVTMITFCYVSFILASKCMNISKLFRGGYLLALVICSVIMEYTMDRMKLPGMMIGVLLIVNFVFCHADKIIDYISKPLKKSYIIIWFVFSLITIVLLYGGLFESHRTTAYILMNCCGLLWFVILLRIGLKVRSGKIITLVSAFSYEIYLVHHPFCTGPWEVYQITNNPLYAFALIVGATLIIAVPLHYLGNWINKQIIK